MGWCFALINGRLAEIFFDEKRGKRIFFGHAYVKESEYQSKREKIWIEKDTKKCQFSYRKGVYKSKDGTTYKCMDLATTPQSPPI